MKLNQATRCLLGRLTKFTIYFLQLILNVRVNNRELWQFMFHEVSYNHDSQNSFSVYHDSRTPKMVNHGVTKIPLPPPSSANWLRVWRLQMNGLPLCHRQFFQKKKLPNSICKTKGIRSLVLNRVAKSANFVLNRVRFWGLQRHTSTETLPLSTPQGGTAVTIPLYWLYDATRYGENFVERLKGNSLSTSLNHFNLN